MLMVRTGPVEEERPECGCKGVRFCAACKDTPRWDKILSLILIYLKEVIRHS